MFEKLTRSRYMTENVTDELIRLENLVKIYDTARVRESAWAAGTTKPQR